MLYIPTGAHLSASGKLYQLKNLKLNFALVSSQAVMPAVPKRRDLVPPSAEPGSTAGTAGAGELLERSKAGKAEMGLLLVRRMRNEIEVEL